ncbi:MAG: two-component regulator propeller domain-containing protein, partial [Parafilimonas sp.]
MRNRCSFYTCSIRKFCCCQFFFLTFSFFIPRILLSQSLPLKSEYLTTIDGLSHNIVQCILQDRQGYIWFGTNYGLNLYDGYAFKVFENIPGDSSSIACNNIISLYQDKDDLIWIGTSTSS